MSGLEEEYYVNEIFNHQDFNSSYGTDGFLYAVNKIKDTLIRQEA